MKKLLLLILLLPILCKAQSPKKYVLYCDSLGYNHVDANPLPQVAISGYYENLFHIPQITINGTTQSVTNGAIWTVSSSITGAQVITALGYTPYNSTNPSAYISSAQAIASLSKTTNYTVLSTDFGTAKVLYVNADATSGNITITLPTYSSFGGYTVYVRKTDATSNTVTISGLDQDYTLGTKGWVKQCIPSSTSWVNN